MNSESAMKIGFHYTCVLSDPDGRVVSATMGKNLFPLEGRNHMLESAIGGGGQIADWFVGLFKGNYTPTNADTAASFAAAALEVTAYAEASRLPLVTNLPNAGVLDSVGHEVTFTLTQDATIYGGFISSSQSKGSTSGILLSAVRFASPQQGYAGQTVKIGAVCTLINV
jgi:hypothetical protein